MLVRFSVKKVLNVADVDMTRTELEEEGVRIALTIVDTPGFGDNIDNEFA